MPPREHLHLGEQMTHRRRMRASTPSGRGCSDGGCLKVGFCEHGVYDRIETAAKRGRAHSGIAEPIDQRLIAEELVDIRPHVAERADDPLPVSYTHLTLPTK